MNLADQKLVSLPELIKLISLENNRQIRKFGAQARPPCEWVVILTEEVGELAQAVLKHQDESRPIQDIIDEAIQVATVALKIAEMCQKIDQTIVSDSRVLS